MMTNKISSYANLNYWLKSLDTTSLKPSNQNSIIVPKVFQLIRYKGMSKAFRNA